MVGAQEHPRVSRRGQVYRPLTLRFISRGNKVPRVLIHLLSLIFRRHASWLQKNSIEQGRRTRWGRWGICLTTFWRRLGVKDCNKPVMFVKGDSVVVMDSEHYLCLAVKHLADSQTCIWALGDWSLWGDCPEILWILRDVLMIWFWTTSKSSIRLQTPQNLFSA